MTGQVSVLQTFVTTSLNRRKVVLFTLGFALWLIAGACFSVVHTRDTEGAISGIYLPVVHLSNIVAARISHEFRDDKAASQIERRRKIYALTQHLQLPSFSGSISFALRGEDGSVFFLPQNALQADTEVPLEEDFLATLQRPAMIERNLDQFLRYDAHTYKNNFIVFAQSVVEKKNAIVASCYMQALPGVSEELITLARLPVPEALVRQNVIPHYVFWVGWVGIGLVLGLLFRYVGREGASANDGEGAQAASGKSIQSFLSSINGNIVVMTASRVLYATSAFTYLLGVEESLTGRDLNREFVHKDDMESLQEYITRTISQDIEVVRFSLRFITILGDVRWVSCVASFVRWNTEPACLLFVSDASELMETGRQKELLNGKLQTLLESCESGVAYFDQRAVLHQANAKWHSVWKNVSAMSPLVANDAYQPDPTTWPECLSRALAQAMAGETVCLSAFEHVVKDGTVCFLEIQFIPLPASFSGVLMLQTDMTSLWELQKRERSLAAQASESGFRLLQLQDHVATIVDAIPTVVLAVDNKLQVTLWNSRAEQRFAMSRHDVMGKNLGAVDRSLARHEPLVHKAMRDKTLLQINLIPCSIGGVTHYESITVMPVETCYGVTAIVRIDDVTQCMHLEESLAQSGRLSSVGLLASGLAHEINNPLSAILQGVQNLQRRLLQNLPGNIAAAQSVGTSFDALHGYIKERDIPAMLDRMQESGERISRIISSMLLFSQKREITRSPVDFAVLVTKALSFARSDCEMRQSGDVDAIQFAMHATENLPKVLCVERDVAQSFMQLLRVSINSLSDNASRQEEGFVPKITLTLQREGNFVKLAIQDNGPGMDAEACKHIFEPFYATHSMKQAGDGIGLSLAFFMVTSINFGRLQCVSTPGTGTTFMMHLPVAEVGENSQA